MVKEKTKINLFDLIYTINILCIVLIPIFLCVVNAFKSNIDIFSDFIALPENIDISNFVYLIDKRNILLYIFNSLKITLIVLTITSIINPFIAYKISINWDKKIYRFLYIAISSAMLIPSKVIIFPLIKIYYNLGLMNTFGLIIYYTVFMIPEMVFLYVPYFKMFSKDLKNAAIIDGSTEFTFYKDVFLPISKPIIITGAILITIWTWNDFFMPLMILNKNPDSWTLPIFIYNFMGKFSAHKNYAFAACVFSLIPISVFYILFHKKILSGFEIKNDKRGEIK